MGRRKVKQKSIYKEKDLQSKTQSYQETAQEIQEKAKQESEDNLPVNCDTEELVFMRTAKRRFDLDGNTLC